MQEGKCIFSLFSRPRVAHLPFSAFFQSADAGNPNGQTDVCVLPAGDKKTVRVGKPGRLVDGNQETTALFIVIVSFFLFAFGIIAAGFPFGFFSGFSFQPFFFGAFFFGVIV